ncbi:MAG: prepilin-type N-terminal cleavage/methylation domain-containing protein [Armatimonadota bacterium]
MRRRRGGLTFVEVLVASMLLGMAAATAIAAWGYLSRVPQSKLLIERGILIATSEIDRRKALGYDYLVRGTTTSWYDAYGTWLGDSATTGAYQAVVTVTGVVPTTPTGTNNDLLEMRVQVRNTAGTATYHDARTLMSWGGM